MRERRVVVTMAIGKAWGRIGALSIPTFRAYAKRIGAELEVIDRRRVSGVEHVHWEKLQLRELIAPYHRALYVDLDALIRPGAGDVFERVPRGEFGAWPEGRRFDRSGDVAGVSKFYGRSAFDARDFFNAGVFVVDRDLHRSFFDRPESFYRGANPEQAYLNMVAAGFPRCHLEPGWSMFPALRAENPGYSIIHFAGRSGNLSALEAEMRAELESWGSA